MTNEELNRRCVFFAEHGLPYSDKVWSLLARAWDDGYDQHKADEQSFQMGEEQVRLNPYRGGPVTDAAQAAILYAKTNPAR